MSVRVDKVQLHLEFFTDESGKFAKSIEDTKRLNKELVASQKEVEKLEKEFKKADEKGANTLHIERKLELARQRMQQLGNEVTRTGASLANLDLSRVAPSQLQQRLRQITQQLQSIPPHLRDTVPHARALEQEFQAINRQINANNTRLRGTVQEIDNARASSSRFGGVLEGAFSMFLGGGILGVVTSVIGVIGNLGKATLQASMEMETNLISITTLLNGNEKAAKAFYDQIQKMAARTPFETKDLAEAGKQLLVFGYSTDDAIKLLGRLGDVAAVTQVPITDLANIVGKAKLGELIQGEELNQLADRGIAVFDELAKVLGVSTAEIKKLGSEGKISYKDLQKAIEMTTEKGGKFYEGMLKQSQTVSGLWSTVKDNFSLLMQTMTSGSTDFLKPFLKVIGDIIGGINEVFTTGKKATGEYGDVINYFVMVLKSLGIVFKVVWEAGKLLWEGFKLQVSALSSLSQKVGEFIAWGEKLPIIGSIFKGISNTIKVLGEYIDNASATTAGFGAATQAILDNMKNAWLLAVNVVKVAAKEIELAFTVDSGKRQAIQGEIANLRQWAASNAQGFKSVSEAYHNARNAAINAAQVAQTQEAALAKKREENAKKTDPKEAAKAAKEAKKEREEAYKAALELEDLQRERMLFIYEQALYDKRLTQNEFVRKEFETDAIHQRNMIALHEAYLKTLNKGTKEYFEVEKKIFEERRKLQETTAILSGRNRNLEPLEALPSRPAEGGVASEQEAIRKRLAEAQMKYDTQEAVANQQRFGRLVNSELATQKRILEIRQKAYEEQLRILRENGQAETKEYKDIAEKKAATDAALVDNKKRTAELQRELETVAMDMTSEALQIGIDLLSKDEEARKKHATAIKAFSIGKILVDLAQETQAIWLNANSNPINALIPGAGTAIAIGQTALAVGRATVATKAVLNQKFARGGLIKMLGGDTHANGGTKGVFSDGTQVEMERGEVLAVVNAQNAPALAMLSRINAANGNGDAFFERGGVFSTTSINPGLFFPAQNTTTTAAQGNSSDKALMYAMLQKFDELKMSVEKNREVKLYRDKLNDAEASDAEDRNLAAWRF